MTGFNQLWAWYVRGFRPEKHCQFCLRGTLSAHLGRSKTVLDRTYVFDETANFNQLYICGVAAGPEAERGRKNLHLPLIPAEGEMHEETTYNGFNLVVTNARKLFIPEPLPALAHLGKHHYRCKNFRFGVEYYGYPW